jgi:uncharacterized flavoprotein (TIGR03862 family)
MAAYYLADHGAVDLHEQGRNVGRKFLVAGDGGLNITNSVEDEALLGHYSPPGFLDQILRDFPPTDLRAWLAELGIPTFTGTSGRVFPQRGIKPAQVLQAIRGRLVEKGVRFHLGHCFVGFDHTARPIMDHDGVRHVVQADRILLALGGASWPRTGSRGDWRSHFEAIGVHTKAFSSSNCGVEVPWPAEVVEHHAGKPLKNIRISAGDPSSEVGFRSVRGEATITRHGLEGNAVYPVVPCIRESLAATGKAELVIDLKPDSTEDQLAEKLRDAAWKERMRALHLDRPSVSLLKAFVPRLRYLDGGSLPYDVKHLHIPVTGLRPMEEAISTVGGIALEEVAPDLSLRKHPHLFVAGEMLDWDAPTGGFLLQAAFSMGRWAAKRMAR